MKVNNILETIGKTPVVRLSKLFPDHQVWMKLEKSNPGGSLKDRIALAMVEDAEKKGIINKNTVIIEPTSGNTGVGLAMVCAYKGYKLILVMPESMSVERRKLITAYGAEFVLTPRELGTAGAVNKAMEMVEEMDNAWMPQQFKNEANPIVHNQTTAQEILADFPEGVDYLITGVGTGGHITGIAQLMKEKFPSFKAFAVEPELSPVINGGKPGPHPLQGIGAGFIPDVLKTELLDGVVLVKNEDAFKYTKKLAVEEGILGGISTGTSLAAIASKIDELEKDKIILTINYDTGERYWSVDNLF